MTKANQVRSSKAITQRGIWRTRKNERKGRRGRAEYKERDDETRRASFLTWLFHSSGDAKWIQKIKAVTNAPLLLLLLLKPTIDTQLRRLLSSSSLSSLLSGTHITISIERTMAQTWSYRQTALTLWTQIENKIHHLGLGRHVVGYT